VIHPRGGTSQGQLAFVVDRELGEPIKTSAASVISAVEIRRSAKRRRTVAARLEGSTLVIYLPERISRAEEAEWVERMRRRFEDRRRRDGLNSEGDLQRRAQELNRKYFGGALSWQSITYVTNQRERYGSCTVDDGTIRLSDVLAGMPAWVRDYVIVHELAHLLVADHSQAFWKLVRRYPQTERAIGFLIAKGLEE
jgi:predicted metal-dependent hydrolase